MDERFAFSRVYDRARGLRSPYAFSFSFFSVTQ